MKCCYRLAVVHVTIRIFDICVCVLLNLVAKRHRPIWDSKALP